MCSQAGEEEDGGLPKTKYEWKDRGARNARAWEPFVREGRIQNGGRGHREQTLEATIRGWEAAVERRGERRPCLGQDSNSSPSVGKAYAFHSSFPTHTRQFLITRGFAFTSLISSAATLQTIPSPLLPPTPPLPLPHPHLHLVRLFPIAQT